MPYPEFPLCFLRDLDARAKNECYRATFRLPKDERLDGHTGCTLWTPFNKLHIPGQMFISNNYICFASKEEDACRLIIPLREVSISALVALGAGCSVWKLANPPHHSQVAPGLLTQERELHDCPLGLTPRHVLHAFPLLSDSPTSIAQVDLESSLVLAASWLSHPNQRCPDRSLSLPLHSHQTGHHCLQASSGKFQPHLTP